MNNGWIYCFVLKAGGHAVKLAAVRFNAHKGRRFLCARCSKTVWDSLFQDLRGLHRLKSQPDKTTKEKSIEISEYKATLLALDVSEP